MRNKKTIAICQYCMDINSNYTNGLWFKKDGSYCLIDENKFGSTDQSPTKCLVTFVKNILLHEPEVRDWIGTNPPKSSIDEPEAEMWWKKVMVVMIQNGWNLAWAGCIHTNLDAKELTKVLKKVPQLVFEKGQLEWPYNGILTIQNLDDDEYQISWGALLGKESNVESVEQIPKLPDNSNLITRLEKLKILFEEKLISTEEYLAKKKEILSQL